jgi:tetratricopeptide (TPR) repeat protein
MKVRVDYSSWSYVYFYLVEQSLEIKKLEDEGTSRMSLFKFEFFIVVYFFVGVRLAEQNRLVEAIEYFNQAIALSPQNPSAYNNRAQAYQLQNQTEG